MEIPHTSRTHSSAHVKTLNCLYGSWFIFFKTCFLIQKLTSCDPDPFCFLSCIHISLRSRVLPMICDVPLMSSAKEVSLLSLQTMVAFCACVCVSMQYMSLFLSRIIRYVSCSVRRSVAAIWLSVTSASVERCSSAAVQTNVYPPESSRQIKPAALEST